MRSKESKSTSNVAKIRWKIPQNPCYSRVKRTSCSLPPFCDVFPLFTRPADFKNFDCLCVAREVLAPDFRFLKCRLLRTTDTFLNQIWRPRTQTVLQRSKQPQKAATRKKISPTKTNKWMNSVTTEPALARKCPWLPVNARIFTSLFSSPRTYFFPKSIFLQTRSTNKHDKRKIGENKNAKFCRFKYQI